MTTAGAAFVVASVVALVAVPRRWALAPLLAGMCYMTLGQGIQIGPFSFTVVRILILAGIVRTLIRREWLAHGVTTLDWIVFSWGAWLVLVGILRHDAEMGVVFRLGTAFNACGFYFLVRTFCTSMDDLVVLSQAVAIVLLPVAAEMLYEQLAVHNVFSALGSVPATPAIREGHVRASGPFTHPILAGTVGASCLPMIIGLWGYAGRLARLGALACIAIVIACASSGPLMSALLAIAALFMWPLRSYMRHFRWLMVAAYIGLELLMKAPAYYLISRIDLAGGSTGWHRARLIESSLEHLSEWWLLGTNYTRHWMPTGVSWSANQADITNYYIKMGVWAGLPLMFLFIAELCVTFSLVGRRVTSGRGLSASERFLSWSLGASVFAHAASCISVSYFDQSVFFLYLVIGAAASAMPLPVLATTGEVSPRSGRRAKFLGSRRLGAKPRLVGQG